MMEPMEKVLQELENQLIQDTRKKYAIFGDNLRKYMAQEGKLPEDIMKATGVSKSAVSCWMNGKKRPTVDKIKIIGDLLGVSYSDLVEEESKHQFTDHERDLIKMYRENAWFAAVVDISFTQTMQRGAQKV